MRLALALLFVVSGCRTRLDSASDGAVVPDPGDMSAGACRTHAREAVPLVELSLIEGADFIAYGMAVRVLVGVPLRQGCDVLGDVAVDVRAGNATNFVDIVASVWRGSGPCGAPVVAFHVVVLEGASMDGLNRAYALRDRAPGGTRSLGFEVGPELTDKRCTPVPPGGECHHDCQCAAVDGRASCVVRRGGAGAACVRSCSRDADCPVVGQACQSTDAPTYTCIPWSGEDCFACQHDCPFGTRCQCVCLPLDRSIFATPCQCDSDCGEGRLCRDDHRCIVPCTTVADCGANGNVCGGGSCSSTR